MYAVQGVAAAVVSEVTPPCLPTQHRSLIPVYMSALLECAGLRFQPTHAAGTYDIYTVAGGFSDLQAAPAGCQAGGLPQLTDVGHEIG